MIESGADRYVYARALTDLARAVARSGARVNIAGARMPGGTLWDRRRRIADGAVRAPVSRTRSTAVVAACAIASIACGITTLRAQTPAGGSDRPAFAVASVKANKSGDLQMVGPRPESGGRLRATNIPLELLIAVAYQPLQRYEISGVPDWAKSERFDIEARADGNPPPAQMWLMVQSLLADRFKLRGHRETKQLPVYALVAMRPGQSGPRLTVHTNDSSCADPVTAAPLAPPDPGQPLPSPPCGAFSGAPALGRLAGQRVSLDTFGRALSGQLGRMVLDRTELTGPFDLTLEWTPQQRVLPVDPTAPATSNAGDGVSIFSAVQEQLGLRLVPQTGPVTVLVIDHLERPSED